MVENKEFVARFIEACGTAEPAKVQRLLNISYQAAKNYLQGRLPQTDVLMNISDRTSYSIDWLLTGRGKKFIQQPADADTPVSAGQIDDLIRKICVEVINEFNAGQIPAQSKIVVLRSSELMSEKVVDEAAALTGRKP